MVVILSTTVSPTITFLVLLPLRYVPFLLLSLFFLESFDGGVRISERRFNHLFIL